MKLAVALAFATIGAMAYAGERCIAIDGDTLVCDHQKIRLTNVYAAELNQSGGAAAKHNLQALVRGNDVVLKRHGHDRYGRTLAEVYVNGHRIEQDDIGPRLGRGSGASADRHLVASSLPMRSTSQLRAKPVRKKKQPQQHKP